jgi:hypothetical protein
MAGALTIRITESAGDVHDVRYRFLWSARLGHRLLGQGHAFDPDSAESQAMDLVTGLVTPDEVERIEVEVNWLTYRALRRPGDARS